MLASSRKHIAHHGRFYVALAIGLVVLASTWQQPVYLPLAGDVFFGVYVALMAVLTPRATAEELRRRACYEDEGIVLIVIITLAAITLSIGSIFTLFFQPKHPDALPLAIAIASVPLGWLTLHTLAAFHYAHLYYTSGYLEGEDPKDAGGLAFPSTAEPAGWDFLYYSFVVGMTAQVSDVQVLTTTMRRLTLAHGVVSFFYNTVILALAVSLVAGQTS